MQLLNQKTGEASPPRSPLTGVIQAAGEATPETHIILMPIISGELPPYMVRMPFDVIVSAEMADKDVYAAPGTRYEDKPGRGGPDWDKPLTVCLAARALERLASAAGIHFDPNLTKRIKPEACERCLEVAMATRIAPRCGDCPCRHDTAYQAAAAAPTGNFAAPWAGRIATKEWTLEGERLKIQREAARNAKRIAERGQTQAEYIEDRIAQVIPERHGLAETKARNRVLRPILGVQSTYPRTEIATKKFRVERIEMRPEAAPPALRDAIFTRALAASQMLFGTGERLALPSGEAPKRVIDAEWTQVQDPDEDDEAPDNDCPSNVDANGVIHDPPAQEVDFGARAEELAPPPAEESRPPKCEDCGSPETGKMIDWCMNSAPEPIRGHVYCNACGTKRFNALSGGSEDEEDAPKVCCPVHKLALQEREGLSKTTQKRYHFWGCPKFRDEECKHVLNPDEYREAAAALQNQSLPGMGGES